MMSGGLGSADIRASEWLKCGDTMESSMYSSLRTSLRTHSCFTSIDEVAKAHRSAGTLFELDLAIYSM